MNALEAVREAMLGLNMSKREAMTMIVKHTRELLVDVGVYSDELCGEIAWELYKDLSKGGRGVGAQIEHGAQSAEDVGAQTGNPRRLSN